MPEPTDPTPQDAVSPRDPEKDVKPPIALVGLPMPRLSASRPKATQTLDREHGVIAVRFSSDSEARPKRSILRFLPCPPGSSEVHLREQDAAIDLLDRFADARFGDLDCLWRLVPPELSTDGCVIRLGRLPVATVTPSGWVRDDRNVAHARAALDPGELEAADRRVQEWRRAPFKLPEETPRLKQDSALRLVVQLSPELDLLTYAAAQRVTYPDDCVLIQANRHGVCRVIEGRHLLHDWRKGHPIKVEFFGHGGRLGTGDRPSLNGYTPETLAERLAQVMTSLKLQARVHAITLISCALASPAFPGHFAADFLIAARQRHLLRPTARVTAYTERVGMVVDRQTGRFLSHRLSVLPGGELLERAPGKTLIYKLDPSSGQVLWGDKYADAKDPLNVDVDPDVDVVFHPIDRGDGMYCPATWDAARSSSAPEGDTDGPRYPLSPATLLFPR